jgi:hypothetical protein
MKPTSSRGDYYVGLPHSLGESKASLEALLLFEFGCASRYR